MERRLKLTTLYGERLQRDNLPSGKTACHEFAGCQMDWVILKEFSEKGVSGYKVSAQDRDAIQDLKEAALKNEFDILLKMWQKEFHGAK